MQRLSTQTAARVQQVIQSPGQPLPADVRGPLERAFGFNFASVRVHTDSAAAESARSLDARAYTVANHVVFARGTYQPRQTTGLNLIAHELAHVVQQRHRGSISQVSGASQEMEVDADPLQEVQAERAAGSVQGEQRPAVSTVTALPPGAVTANVQRSTGRRGPDARRGPVDVAGDSRAAREERRAGGGGTGSGGGGAGPFACGLDVTKAMIKAISDTRNTFNTWSDDQKHEACQSLVSLSTGAYAWDIIDLHSQVTGDVINNGYRPDCATSGAKPACGSSVTVDGSCHFAGSANYVIWGVMCRLCFTHYDRMLNKASWYEVFDKDTYRQGKMKFSESGMLYYIDLYKKYIPMLTGDSPASNIRAAKRWSVAGRRNWPTHAATPEPDRDNCQLTCPHSALANFRISWHPHLNPYSR